MTRSLRAAMSEYLRQRLLLPQAEQDQLVLLVAADRDQSVGSAEAVIGPGAGIAARTTRTTTHVGLAETDLNRSRG